jgi:hypothetical protein
VRPGLARAAPVEEAGARTLKPGRGFTAPLLEPDKIGDGPGSDARAIARFDVVQHQVFSEAIEIGVIAFHRNGIERVDFSAAGGPWIPVREISENPRTRVWEYWAVLRAADLPDGPVEVRAIAWPNAGRARLLEPLHLVANARGTIPRAERFVDAASGSDEEGDGSRARPFRTIDRAARDIDEKNGSPHHADNGIVHLAAGDYDFAGRASASDPAPRTQHAWLTIAAATGVAAARVRLTGSTPDSALATKLIRLQNLTVEGVALTSPARLEASVWFDGCTLSGGDRKAAVTFAGPTSFPGGIYATNTRIRSNRDGLPGAALQRSVDLEDIGSDAFHNPKLVVNCTVDGIDSSGTDCHPDVLQLNGHVDNVIVFGLSARRCRSQGIFSRGDRDEPPDTNLAFVNVIVELRSSMLGQWLQSADHVLLWHVTFVGAPFAVLDDDGASTPTRITNLSIRNSVFEKLVFKPSGGPSPRDAGFARNNHFVDVRSHGAVAIGQQATSGGALSTLFADPARGDYRPKAGSPLVDRVPTALVPVDARGVPLRLPASIGALQP